MKNYLNVVALYFIFYSLSFVAINVVGHNISSKFIQMEEYEIEDIEDHSFQVVKITTTQGEEFSYSIGWVQSMGLHKGSLFSRPALKSQNNEN